MSAHTDGPWHLIIERFPGRPDEITGVCGDEGQTISNDIPHPPDAILIAAAPELLAALERCMEYLDCIPESAAGGDDDARKLAIEAGYIIQRAKGL